MHRPMLLALLFCLVLCPLAAAALPPAAPGHPPDVANDTAAVHARAGGNGKLSTDLARLVEPAARLPGQSRGDVAAELRGHRAYRGESSLDAAEGAGEVYVYVELKPGVPTARADPFAELVARDEANGVVSAWVPAHRLVALTGQPFVRSVRSVMPAVAEIGSVTSEGDAFINGSALRAATGLTGAGIRVGVVSDGVDHWADAAASGDLPADFHVLSNTAGGDEGTAMAEIAHDIAPAAPLYFHDWGDGVDYLLFNQAVTALADAGCTVIADDIVWYDQPMFEDGPVAQTIESVIASKGPVYVASGGNSAQKHYQGQFRDLGGSYAGWHDFRNGGTGSYTQLYYRVPAGSWGEIFLQWDDRWGQSANDYDLYLCKPDGTVLGSSLKVQDGDDNPLEVAWVWNTGTADQEVVVWVKKAPAAAARELEAYIVNKSGTYIYPQNIVAADSVPGNHASPNQICVAASDVLAPGGLEAFSSHGPATFRWPSAVQRQKPDLTAPDGGLITGAGGFGKLVGAQHRFYGTSAAGPHVAGLVALAWSGRPTATGAEVRMALLDTAKDAGPAGYDSGWGRGWVDGLAFAKLLGAVPAVKAVPPGTVMPTDVNADWKYEDVNGNGRKDFADVVLFFNQMSWITANEPVPAFDYNGNGRIDFADAVWLFNHL